MAILRSKSSQRMRSGIAAGGLSGNAQTVGVHIVGYAKGEFGRGEDVRQTARALAANNVKFSIVDVLSASFHGLGDASASQWISRSFQYPINILLINADALPEFVFHAQKELLEGRTNIGYWAWELPHCPRPWDLSLDLVHEVWAPSRFIRDSFAERARIPVVYMPLAATLPELSRPYAKMDFGLAEREFYFLYGFDAASWLERKNPVAAVRAFKLAFPFGHGVGLVLKIMNLREGDPKWQALLGEIADDPRIKIITERLARDELIGLVSVCDCYLSLHRSEGFGRGPIEAMLLGKPVIVTNYSGVTEYANMETACLVDFRLIPLGAEDYIFWEGQQWADPDIEHAAWHMRRLVADPVFARSLGRAGQRFVQDNFNERVIGARYAKRLEELSSTRRELATSRLAGASSTEPDAKGLTPEDAQTVAEGQRETKLRHDVSGAQKAAKPSQLPWSIITIDSPAMGHDRAADIPSISDYAIFEGWALAESGVARLTLEYRAQTLAEAFYGISRLDVAANYPNMANAINCGFFCRFDTKVIPDGRANLRLVLHNTRGEAYFIEFFVVVDNSKDDYQLWVAKNKLSVKTQGEIRAQIASFRANPIFSIVAAVTGDDDIGAVARTLSSIREQSYTRWQTTLVIDPAADKKIFAGLGEGENRISVVDDWTETCLAQRTYSGDFVGILKAGDQMDPNALFAFANTVEDDPSWDFIYADEDGVGSSGRRVPFFKPDWSPLWQEGANYIGRPWFAKASVAQKLASRFDRGARHEVETRLLQDLTGIIRRVAHIPAVLCTREESSLDKPRGEALALVSQRTAEGPAPKVSIIILTRLSRRDVVEKCFQSLLERTAYPDYEVIVVTNNLKIGPEEEAFLARWPFKYLKLDQPYNWSLMNNFAAARAQGSMLLFFNDDIEVLVPEWLDCMLRLAQRPDIGAVGAKLFYPNGTIQHAGITLVDYGGGARHALRFCAADEDCVRRYGSHDREWMAVTGACLMVRRELFDALGGLDESLPIIANDTDFCLRLLEKGYRNAVAVGAELIHYEGLSRAGIPEHEDVDRFWARWGHVVRRGDPYLNPNFDKMRDDMAVNPEAERILKGRQLLRDIHQAEQSKFAPAPRR
jgi:GT2 family glycosyltransferase/glycosyltransferase involved in cell wall biosynthesis